MDRRRGRNTLTNEDATYGWRKSFRYVAKRQNGVQEQVRILPDPLRRTLAVTGRRRKGVHYKNARLRRSGSRLG